MPAEQSFQSHTRWDPAFHFFLAPVFLINVVLTGIWISHHHEHPGDFWPLVLALAFVVLTVKVRSYSLKVQDRVIRLEERARLKELCTPAELAELDSLTVRQYVALRFASNPELPELARRAVRENLNSKQIKAAIKSWRADHHRV